MQLGSPAAAHDLLLQEHEAASRINSSQAQQLCSAALMQLRQKFGAAGLSVAKLALRLGPSEQQQLTEQLVMQCVVKGQMQQALKAPFE